LYSSSTVSPDSQFSDASRQTRFWIDDISP
jgi:hypothetical protein